MCHYWVNCSDLTFALSDKNQSDDTGSDSKAHSDMEGRVEALNDCESLERGCDLLVSICDIARDCACTYS
jgi:hypothetical protein